MSTAYPEVKYCQFGRVVVLYENNNEIFGHITGFARDANQKLMIRVQWEGDQITSIYPKDVEFITEEQYEILV